MTTRKIAVIYNQRAGSLIHNREQPFDEFLRQYFKARPDCSVQPMPFDPQQLDQLQRDIVASGCESLWVAGGDGTVLTLSAMARQLQLPMGILPAGTMNLMARDLGMSLDLRQAIGQLLAAEPRWFDMAELNGHHFLCISNVGMCTRLTEEKEKMRHRNPLIKWGRLAMETCRFAFIHPAFRVSMEANGKKHRLKTRAFTVTNNPLKAGPGIIPERNSLDSGELGVYVSRDVSVWALPRLIIRYIKGTWKQDADLLEIHTSKLTVHFHRQRKRRVMIDGERYLLTPPLVYRSHPAAIQLLCPATADTDIA